MGKTCKFVRIMLGLMTPHVISALPEQTTEAQGLFTCSSLHLFPALFPWTVASRP